MKARLVLLGALLPYVLWLIFGYRYHFLDGVNLLLHEAGHVFFGFFGDTLQFLGGTLGQLLFPALFVAHFWRRGQKFEAYVVLIWLAESLMYTAEYIGDARVMLLPLVGGHIHDWNWLLSHWGILAKAEDIGKLTHFVASFLAIWALVIAAAEAKRTPERDDDSEQQALGQRLLNFLQESGRKYPRDESQPETHSWRQSRSSRPQ